MGGSLTKYFTNTVNDTFSESQDLMGTGCTETVSLRSSLFTYTGRGLALESLNSPDQEEIQVQNLHFGGGTNEDSLRQL